MACTQQLSNGSKIRVPRGTALGLNPPLASAARARTARPCGRQEIVRVLGQVRQGVRHWTLKYINPRKKCVLSNRPREAADCEDYSKCYLWSMGDWAKPNIGTSDFCLKKNVPNTYRHIEVKDPLRSSLAPPLHPVTMDTELERYQHSTF